MEQTSSKTEADSLEDQGNLYESPSDLLHITFPDPEDYPLKEEDPVIDGKLGDEIGNLRSKKYSKITDEQRREFINAVENDGEKIINAAKRFDINYSSAKSILNVFKSEGRSMKKQFRHKDNRNLKDSKGESEGSFVKNQTAGDVREKIPATNNASTQTMSDSAEEENSLLVLRDRLLASKTEKRQNPYEGLSSHEFTRFSGSLNDYSGSQLASDPSSIHGASQGFNLSGNSNQSFTSQQNVQRSDPMGYGNVPSGYRFFQQGGDPNMLQNSPPTFQQQPKISNFADPPRQQDSQNYGSMVYSGVNPVQYFTMNPSSDQMRRSQMEQQQQQYQFLQPVIYMMPALQSNMNQPYIIPQQNNSIIFNQNNNPGQNQKGVAPNFQNQYPNMK